MTVPRQRYPVPLNDPERDGYQVRLTTQRTDAGLLAYEAHVIVGDEEYVLGPNLSAKSVLESLLAFESDMRHGTLELSDTSAAGPRLRALAATYKRESEAP